MRWPWQRKRETLAPPNVPGDWTQSRAWCEWDSPRNVIAGEQSYDGALAKLAGPTCKDGYCFAVVVRLVREPTNPYDRNAIRAEVEGELVGYLRRQIAEQLAGRLDAAECSSFEVAGVIRGGSRTARNLGCHVWLERRVSPGPVIAFDDATWRVAWPPRDAELATRM